ncbi:hypothetical protein C1645_422408 [Glomus cerebriforme]|uniref:Uncharacterized protein n=1 Tax=Glomus cerebriforme TaxID=658196 RepID=A0A397SI21_9GLOM|nr:hypothetical protein C1645_422408 [Glomus cerebriforme]
MGNCVSCKIEIHNNSKVYFLQPVDKSFIWGRMSDQTASLEPVFSGRKSIRGVQGRSDSISGVEGSFTFDVIHEIHKVDVARIKLNFDVPYDNNVYTRKATSEINHVCNNNHIQISTTTTWGGYGFSQNTISFSISTSDDQKIKDEVKKYVERQPKKRDEF